MEKIEVEVYSFEELSEKSKQKALNDFRYGPTDNQFYFDEIIESVKAVIELFGLEAGRRYSDIRYSHIDDNILNLSGRRLYAYIMNNFYHSLFTPKYIMTIDKEVNYKPFICKVGTNHKGEKYTQIYSRIFRVNDGCPLTGVYFDYNILQPVYDFLKKPGKSTTFEDIIKDIESAIFKTFEETENWINSDSFIIDLFEANEYRFLKNGKVFN